MSTKYDDTNTFVLFQNDRRREGKNDPTRNGRINIMGKWFWFMGWDKKEGVISGRIGDEISAEYLEKLNRNTNKPEQQQRKEVEPDYHDVGGDFDDDSIPF